MTEQGARTVEGARAAGGSRLAWVAYLRVLAILAVVAIHVSGLVVAKASLQWEPVWWAGQVLRQVSRWSVPMFVMISGALLLRPKAMDVPLAAFYRKRLNRIVPALLVWHVVYLAFTQLVLRQGSSLKSMATAFLLGRTYTALYFFWLILGLYLMAPLLWRMVAGRAWRERLGIALALTAFATSWTTLNSGLTAAGVKGLAPVYTVLTYWVPYVGYFLLGAVLVEATLSRRATWIWSGVLVATTALTFWQSVWPRPSRWLSIVAPPGYFGWFVALGCVALFLVARSWFAEGSRWARPPLGRWIDSLGERTLGVFAVHLLVLYALQRLSGIGTTVTTVTELVFLYVGTAVGAFTVSWLLSRLPLARRIV